METNQKETNLMKDCEIVQALSEEEDKNVPAADTQEISSASTGGENNNNEALDMRGAVGGHDVEQTEGENNNNEALDMREAVGGHDVEQTEAAIDEVTRTLEEVNLLNEGVSVTDVESIVIPRDTEEELLENINVIFAARRTSNSVAGNISRRGLTNAYRNMYTSFQRVSLQGWQGGAENVFTQALLLMNNWPPESIGRNSINDILRPAVSERTEPNNCAICLEPLVGVYAMVPCMHSYHRACISRWLEIKPFCPICRTYFITSDQMAPYMHDFLKSIERLRKHQRRLREQLRNLLANNASADNTTTDANANTNTNGTGNNPTTNNNNSNGNNNSNNNES